MKHQVFLLAMMVAAPAWAQEHAPSVETCRADVAVWGDASDWTEYDKAEAALLRDGTPNRTPINELSLAEIFERVDEMANCEKVDPEQLDKYDYAVRNLGSVFGYRAQDFIRRHRLSEQFMREDRAGLRGIEPEPQSRPGIAVRPGRTTFRGHTLGETWSRFIRTEGGTLPT